MDKNIWLDRIRSAKKIDKFSSIVDRCRDKVVLDVGCVGQDKGYEDEGWLHGRIKRTAKKLIGSDIDTEGIDELNKRGYEIYRPEKLIELETKFDLIVLGDVIEHVNDPGSFLTFYSSFLKPDGKMIICTPNSFGARYFIQVLIYGKPGTNEEHTLSFDPYVMLELFQRLNLKPVEFYWLKEYRKGANWKQKIILAMAGVYTSLRKYFNANFMFVVERK